MKNINLLPKIPYIQQIFLPVLLATVTLFAGTSMTILLVHHQLSNNQQSNESSIAQINAEMSKLTSQKTIDPITKGYQDLLKETNQLKAAIRDWMPVYDLIASNLPKASRLISAGNEAAADTTRTNQQTVPNNQTNVAANTNLTLSLEFANLEDAASYIVLLQQSSLIESVDTKTAKRIERDMPVANQKQQDTIGAIAAPTGTQPTAPLTQEELLKQLEQSTSKSDTDSDVLLNELKWTVSQKMYDEQFGVKVPDKKFPTKSPTPSQSPLTKEDFNSAKTQLDQFKKQKITNNTTTGTMTSDKAQPNQTVAPKKLTLYQVTLDVKLKQKVQEKK